MAESYEKAGVNLEAGYEVVRRIKKHVASTARTGVMGTIGAFGGMFDLAALGVKEPVLVSGTDGVGTKLKLAFALDKHDTIGIDAVAMCVNDVLAQGAEPLFFLDYVAVGHNEPVKIEGIVCGVAEGCRQAGCALVGGETAEMPGMYEGGEYDIAGFTVGVVERSRLIDGSKVKTGDVLVGIASSGVHSNGFSLVRKVLSDNGLELNKVYPELSNRTLGEVLLTPTKIYVKPVLDVIRRCDVHGISHITGGGFDENIPRILHEGQGIAIEEGTWEILPVFRFLEKYGKIAHREMFNIFNMGVGMVIALDAEEAQKAVDILASHGEQASVIGRVTDSEGGTRRLRPARGARHGARGGAGHRLLRLRAEGVCLEGRLRTRDRRAARCRGSRSGLSGGVHAHPLGGAARRLRRADRQHPSLAAARLQGGARDRGGRRLRGEGLRGDDPLGRRHARRRADHRAARLRLRRRRRARGRTARARGGA